MKRIKLLIFTCLTILLSFSLFGQYLILPLSAESSFVPINIHLSWSSNDTQTTMTVMWRTRTETSSVVQYGLSNSLGSEVSFSEDALIHEVKLTQLTPDSLYYYRVGNGQTWSKNLTFKTGNDYYARFVMWGDSQIQRNRIEPIQSVFGLKPEFNIFTGDFIDMGKYQEEWYQSFKDFEPVISESPMMNALGNHEKNHSNYYELCALPGKEEYYSFNYGPVHFVVLHTEDGWANFNYTEQVNWLKDDLEAHADYTWKIVSQHHPVMASSMRYHTGEYDTIIAELLPVFKEYGVDFVVSGHDHFYERLFNNSINFIITGGMGSQPTKVIDGYLLNESVCIESSFHSLLFHTYENQIDMRSLRTNYTQIDRLTINKISKPDLVIDTVPVYTSLKSKTNETIIVNITVSNIGEENLTQSTTMDITSPEGNVFTVDIPGLKVGENFTHAINWDATFGMHSWSINLDPDNLIDEVVEENNQRELVFSLEKEIELDTEPSSYLVTFVPFGFVIFWALTKRKKN